MVARMLSYCLNLTVSIGISTSRPSHVTVHPAAKWIPANKDRNGNVLTEISEYNPLHFVLYA